MSTDLRCELCGSPVRVVGTDEGTQHYEPAPALDVERLNRAFYNTPRLPGLQETARQHIERVAVEYADG